MSRWGEQANLQLKTLIKQSETTSVWILWIYMSDTLDLGSRVSKGTFFYRSLQAFECENIGSLSKVGPPFISQGGGPFYIFVSHSLGQAGGPWSWSVGRSYATGRAWRSCVRPDFLGNGSSCCHPISVGDFAGVSWACSGKHKGVLG